jgi:hypothetical protein
LPQPIEFDLRQGVRKTEGYKINHSFLSPMREFPATDNDCCIRVKESHYITYEQYVILVKLGCAQKVDTRRLHTAGKAGTLYLRRVGARPLHTAGKAGTLYLRRFGAWRLQTAGKAGTLYLRQFGPCCLRTAGKAGTLYLRQVGRGVCALRVKRGRFTYDRLGAVLAHCG